MNDINNPFVDHLCHEWYLVLLIPKLLEFGIFMVAWHKSFKYLVIGIFNRLTSGTVLWDNANFRRERYLETS